MGHLATERPCVLALILINSQLFLIRSQLDHTEERQIAFAGELFISIYNLASVITAQSINSIEREKITMLSNGSMEEFYENDALVSTFFNSNNTTNESDACSMSGSGASKNTKHEFILKRWCDKNKSAQGGIGNGNANDTRRMTSRTITKNGRDVVVITYQISSKGDQAKKIIRKIINK